MQEPSDATRLSATVRDELARYFRHLGERVERAVRSLPREKLWVKPFPFGNSVGHLVLHLTGNLNHYIGAGIARTGYVRDRPREFSDPAQYPAEEVLERFREAIALVVRTLEGLDAEGLMVPVADQPPIQTQFGLLLVCAAHLNNHIGQMSYLVQAQGHSTQEPPIW
ncbi:MAG: DinB family protein [Isosphaeraceae bacterium]|nr:DinB family protein [Isosphaeraceae bacterium]